MGGDELVIKNVAELIDRLKPGPSPGQVGLVVLQNLLLLLLQCLGYSLLLLGIVNWWQFEGFQEIIQSLVEEKGNVIDFFNDSGGYKETSLMKLS